MAFWGLVTCLPVGHFTECSSSGALNEQFRTIPKVKVEQFTYLQTGCMNSLCFACPAFEVVSMYPLNSLGIFLQEYSKTYYNSLGENISNLMQATFKVTKCVVSMEKMSFLFTEWLRTSQQWTKGSANGIIMDRTRKIPAWQFLGGNKKPSTCEVKLELNVPSSNLKLEKMSSKDTSANS